MISPLTNRAVVLTNYHHEAWAVEVLGDAADLQSEELELLVRGGYLSPEYVHGRPVSGMRHNVDPWMFSVLIGTLLGDATPERIPEMRNWPLSRWKRAIDALLDERAHQDLSKGLSDWIRAAGSGIQNIVAKLRRRLKQLSGQETATYAHVQSRVGTYVTKLSEEAKAKVREIVQASVGEGLSATQLMLRLSSAFRGQSRDWLRVARTEMQAANNEAVATQALEEDGPTARVARVPEHDACEKCLELYLDSSGKPRIWELSDLIANGTNFGRKQSQWQATLYPLHSNCRCGLVRVPPGYEFDASWNLVPAR